MDSLPYEITLNIIYYLRIEDVMMLSLTNKRLYYICNDHLLWNKRITFELMVPIKLYSQLDLSPINKYRSLSLFRDCFTKKKLTAKDIKNSIKNNLFVIYKYLILSLVGERITRSDKIVQGYSPDILNIKKCVKYRRFEYLDWIINNEKLCSKYGTITSTIMYSFLLKVEQIALKYIEDYMSYKQGKEYGNCSDYIEKYIYEASCNNWNEVVLLLLKSRIGRKKHYRHEIKLYRIILIQSIKNNNNTLIEYIFNNYANRLYNVKSDIIDDLYTTCYEYNQLDIISLISSSFSINK